jgi:hypothetical protein
MAKQAQEWHRAAEIASSPEAADQANAEIKALLDETTKEEPVKAELPPDDLVTLPGGLVKDGKVIKTAIVKELNGEDEEALARASQSMNTFHFFDRLLKCGVAGLGDVRDPEEILKDLLIGDRDALILGIRKATYGDDIEINNWKCDFCGATATLSMTTDDIPVKKMVNPADETVFKVPLRKGGTVEARLATGEDQIAALSNKELTQAQVETIFLQRCVLSITDKNGVRHSMQGYPSLALEMSMPDRHKVLNELRDRQPGPKYDEVKYKCETCGEDTLVAVGLGDLFLDIRWF